ncbi:MAG: adenylate/guanylate cyclase domain-containing protein [Candidatus Kapaibacteriota bacterium]
MEQSQQMLGDQVIAESSARTLLNIALDLQSKATFDEAYSMAQQALELALVSDNQLLIAEIYSLLGSLSNELALFRQSIEFIRKSGSIYEKKGMMKETAELCNKLGVSYAANSDFTKAIDYHLKALGISEEQENDHETALSYMHIGNAYSQMLEYSSALEYQQTALSLAEQIQDRQLIGRILCNLGVSHSNLGNNEQGLEFILQSIGIFKELNDKRLLALLLANLAHMYMQLKNFEKALEYSMQSLTLSEEMHHVSLLIQNYNNLGIIYSEPDSAFRDSEKAKEYLHKALEIATEHDMKEKLMYINKDLSAMWEYSGEYKKSLEHFKLHVEIENALLNTDVKKQVQELETERVKLLQEKEFEEERIAAAERTAILENILPPAVIARLLQGEKKVLDKFTSVCVLFLDIASFTEISEGLEPEELLDLMDSIFTEFDEISNRYGLEKIKTIGDAYMAVCGAHVKVEYHALKTIYAALEMMNIHREIMISGEKKRMRFRVGLHCGNVVGGIIGENKYSYDLWGDAVNTASRMETYSEPGHVHASTEFIEVVKKQTEIMQDHPVPFMIVKREPIHVKGKGIMQTYFIEPA